MFICMVSQIGKLACVQCMCVLLGHYNNYSCLNGLWSFSVSKYDTCYRVYCIAGQIGMELKLTVSCLVLAPLKV